jgi:transcriptional regulator with XRE-family HTH domain
MKFFKEDPIVPAGSIGWRIKRYRELRGLTQKQLGVLCGFPEGSADVRIAQYEKNKKVPRDNVLKLLAEALNIDELALFNEELYHRSRMYHILFEIEDLYGLHPVLKEDGCYYLEFSGPTLNSKEEVSYASYQSFLEKWQQMRQQYGPNRDDSAEEREKKSREYSLWKGGFPANESEENWQRILDAARKHSLQTGQDSVGEEE